jgi:thioredoxin-like negative regulator of GroEL
MADISMDFEVAAVPTFLFFKSGKLLKRIEGAKADDVVTKAVKSLASQKSSGSARPPANKTEEETVSRKETLDESSARLKKLINSSTG